MLKESCRELAECFVKKPFIKTRAFIWNIVCLQSSVWESPKEEREREVFTKQPGRFLQLIGESSFEIIIRKSRFGTLRNP